MTSSRNESGADGAAAPTGGPHLRSEGDQGLIAADQNMGLRGHGQRYDVPPGTPNALEQLQISSSPRGLEHAERSIEYRSTITRGRYW